MLAAIACMTADGVIGKNGKLPWSCTDDMQRFKRLTAGDNVVMGHVTARSLGKPLPGRTNYVVSKWPQLEGFNGLSPLALPYRLCDWQENPEVTWIIGGARLYQDTLPLCSILHLTILHEDYDGDTHFPVELRDRFFVEKERIGFADGVFTAWYRRP